MIDQKKLKEAYENDEVYALQLEVGDTCYQDCIYCYMNALPKEVNSLTDEEITSILNDAKKLGVTAIEWLGGEPLLRKTIFRHMEYSRKLGFRNNVWTGGLEFWDKEIVEKTVALTKKGLISVHIPTVNPVIYKELHNGKEDLKELLNGVRAVLKVEYPAEQMLNSVTFTGMQTTDDMIKTIDFFENEFGIKTSLNVYHTYLRPGTRSSELAKFIPQRNDVAVVAKRVADQWGLKQPIMNCVNKKYCSATIAVLCDGSVTACATIRNKDAPNIHDDSLLNIFNKHKDTLIIKELKDNLLDDCKKCSANDICWGCRSRSFAEGKGLLGKDPRCFRCSSTK